MSISHQAKKKCQWLILQGNENDNKNFDANEGVDDKLEVESESAYEIDVGDRKVEVFWF